MVDALTQFAEALASLFAEAGMWLVGGFLVAGLLHAFVSKEMLARHLGKKGIGSVLKATLISARAVHQREPRLPLPSPHQRSMYPLRA